MLLNIANQLLKEKILEYEDINSILEKNKDISILDFQKSVIDTGRIDSRSFGEFIKKFFNTSIEDIKNLEIEKNVLRLIRKKTATTHLVLPLRIIDEKLVVAMTNPADLILIDELSFESGHDILPVISSKDDIREKVVQCYNIDSAVDSDSFGSANSEQTGEKVLSTLKEIELDKNGEDIQDYEEKADDRSAGKIENGSSDINPFMSAAGYKTEKPDVITTSEKHTPDNPFLSSVSQAEQASWKKDSELLEKPGIEDINPFSTQSTEDKKSIDDKDIPLTIGEEETANEEKGEKQNTADSEIANPFKSHLSPDTAVKTVESNPFTPVKQPVEPETEIGDSAAAINKSKNYHAKSLNILVVDQSKTTRDIINDTFKDSGYGIIFSGDAIDAMSKINVSKPDIVLIDINLPHLDGYQLCKIIKKNNETKNIPVVMLSGKDGIFDKMKGKIAGASQYVTKPFRPIEIINIVETLTKSSF